MTAKELGYWGEELSCKMLAKKGYTIVKRNYFCRIGEIDIIATNRDYLVFVEVKLRKNSNYAQAREFVTKSKQDKIKKSAMLFLNFYETEKQIRFDVVEVYAPKGADEASARLYHLQDAFR